jgi:rubredoxin
VPFAAEADIPPTWQCRVCGAEALRRDVEQPEAKAVKPARTHWDMLLERRTIAELEEVLAERLDALHQQQGAVKAQLKAQQAAERNKARRKSA